MVDLEAEGGHLSEQRRRARRCGDGSGLVLEWERASNNVDNAGGDPKVSLCRRGRWESPAG